MHITPPIPVARQEACTQGAAEATRAADHARELPRHRGQGAVTTHVMVPVGPTMTGDGWVLLPPINMVILRMVNGFLGGYHIAQDWEHLDITYTYMYIYICVI